MSFSPLGWGVLFDFNCTAGERDCNDVAILCDVKGAVGDQTKFIVDEFRSENVGRETLMQTLPCATKESKLPAIDRDIEEVLRPVLASVRVVAVVDLHFNLGLGRFWQ
ncbi:hypothetical protein N7E70_027990 (plasmid) [Aminobacter sp. NyZ550]|uniref:Uncharacterized protein n=1 Tax=Neoaquamicrobium microcysteis TaxID=2682781 RepID=A0A5D4H5U7_9HYPH|nr:MULTISPECIES: hypothetical protein [Phyllobacteriaceae]TYR35884.1 hypothetical protein FY036_01735 [Mesorhizobium microcysteis]WAX98434.1 hypothetical protein N7E70_027990 [Aminobacter sp. NyZ550]